MTEPISAVEPGTSGRSVPFRDHRVLRVLHIGKFYPPHRGGIESHLETLCGELQKSVEVQVVVANDDRRTVHEVLNGVPVSRLSTWLTVFSTPVCPALAATIRAARADVVHIQLPNPAAALAYLSSGHRGHLVVTYQSDIVRQRFLGTMIAPLVHATLDRSSAIIATSPQYIQTSPVLTAYRDRCHVIPLGLPVQRLAQADSAIVAGLRRQFGDRLVLSVGRLVYYKGFEYLIRAMAEVRGKLVIIGDGPLRLKLQALAAQVGVADKVIFMGTVQSELTPYYHAADVFVLASVARSEAFGLVQVEAMAAGIPVINTQLDSGVPFVSLHGQTGLTVPPADAGALSAAINRLLDDRNLRESFGRAARLRAQQEFSVEVMSSRTVALYNKITGACDPRVMEKHSG